MAAALPARTPWRVEPTARPLRHWAARELQLLCARIASGLERWGADWGLAAQPVEASAGPGSQPEGPAHCWTLRSSDGQPVAWLHFPGPVLDELAQRLFGAGDATAPVTRGVCEDCESSLVQHLCAAFGLLPPQASEDGMTSIPQELAQPWSGVAHAALPLGATLLAGPGLHCALAVQRPRPAAARLPLVAVQQAAAHLPVRLEAVLAQCRLDVGTLASLVPGDVLPLQHRLDGDVRLLGAHGQSVLRGWLGRRGPLLALELAKGGS